MLLAVSLPADQQPGCITTRMSEIALECDRTKAVEYPGIPALQRPWGVRRVPASLQGSGHGASRLSTEEKQIRRVRPNALPMHLMQRKTWRCRQVDAVGFDSRQILQLPCGACSRSRRYRTLHRVAVLCTFDSQGPALSHYRSLDLRSLYTKSLVNLCETNGR